MTNRWWKDAGTDAAGRHDDGLGLGESEMTCQSLFAILGRMDVERIIDDIRQLEEMFESADIRPLKESDICAANRRHDQELAHSPWFKLWQHYGICCRTETPRIQLPE